MPKQKENNFNLILIVIALLAIIWLFYTGIIWYIVGIGVIVVVGYVGIKMYNANQIKTKEVFAPQKTSFTAQEPTIIKEKEIIKEVVMVPCEYCRCLMSQTTSFCPNCGARRTR